MKQPRNKFLTTKVISNMLVVLFGVLLFMGLSNWNSVAAWLQRLYNIISPFVIGVAIAYLLNLPARFFATRVYKNFKRAWGLSVITVFVLALAIIALLLGTILPQVFDSALNLATNITGYINGFDRWLNNVIAGLDFEPDLVEQVMGYYTGFMRNLPNVILSVVSHVPGFTMQLGSGIFSFFTGVIAAVYMLLSKSKMLRQSKRVLYAALPRRRADEVLRIARLSDGVFSGFIGGKILDSAIIGAICFVFMAIMDAFIYPMPYALMISVVVGVTNIIPFFGPFIGAIPSIMILLLINPWSALIFAIFILVLQQVDGNFIGPKILGNSTGLPAFWVLVSIVVGGGLFGFTGMLLAVPTVAVLYTLSSDIVEKRLQKKGIQLAANPADDETPPAAAPPPAASAADLLVNQRGNNTNQPGG